MKITTKHVNLINHQNQNIVSMVFLGSFMINQDFILVVSNHRARIKANKVFFLYRVESRTSLCAQTVSVALTLS